MRAPRLEVDLGAVADNTTVLVRRLGRRGVGVTAVTKAVLAAPAIAAAMLDGGAAGLADSRLLNLRRLRDAFGQTPITLIRAPMLADADDAVALADVSLNTEPAVLEALSRAAARRGVVHGIVLMVELGDLREGIMPAALEPVVKCVARLPNLGLHGLGTNLACRSGVVPDAHNMGALDLAVEEVEDVVGHRLALVSGGNSATIGWVTGASSIGRVNDLRLGEAILLGRDPLDRSPISGLNTGAFRLVAEVIESSLKPACPWGQRARAAFGAPFSDDDEAGRQTGPHQSIFAMGRQDTDPGGLEPPEGMTIVGSSSDHLVVRSSKPLTVGQQVSFSPDYGALLRAMTSPFVGVHHTDDR